MKYKIFLSSVQKEFEQERLFIKQEIENDYLLNRFFEIFAFEKTPASEKSPQELYSQEVTDSDIYIGLIGSDYGNVLKSGISPTELEHDLLNKAHNDAYIFVKQTEYRDENTTKFLHKIRDERSYQRFRDKYELFTQIRKSLGDFLNKNLKNYRAFDREIISNSSCDDVDLESLDLFFDVLEYEPLKSIRKSKGLTLREALVNALAHRDYTIQTASITFYIYPDRIEIKSPGRLVYPLKVSELEENKPIHRNETLSRIFSKTIYMEHVGTGIKRMKDEMKRFGLEEPEFTESGEFFKVTFRNNVNDILNDRQRIFLKSNIDEITTQEYMDMFEISRNTAVKDLNQLIDGKYINKNKNGRTVFYKLVV